MADFVRSDQPGDGDERSILLGWLAFHRDALEAKCQGLTDEQLVDRSADPSRLSLLGIVRHMAEELLRRRANSAEFFYEFTQ